MNFISSIIDKILLFDKEPQKVGLSQFKEETAIIKPKAPSIRNKDVKLSDLMRRTEL